MRPAVLVDVQLHRFSGALRSPPSTGTSSSTPAASPSARPRKVAPSPWTPSQSGPPSTCAPRIPQPPAPPGRPALPAPNLRRNITPSHVVGPASRSRPAPLDEPSRPPLGALARLAREERASTDAPAHGPAMAPALLPSAWELPRLRCALNFEVRSLLPVPVPARSGAAVSLTSSRRPVVMLRAPRRTPAAAPTTPTRTPVRARPAPLASRARAACCVMRAMRLADPVQSSLTPSSTPTARPAAPRSLPP